MIKIQAPPVKIEAITVVCDMDEKTELHITPSIIVDDALVFEINPPSGASQAVRVVRDDLGALIDALTTMRKQGSTAL